MEELIGCFSETSITPIFNTRMQFRKAKSFPTTAVLVTHSLKSKTVALKVMCLGWEGREMRWVKGNP